MLKVEVIARVLIYRFQFFPHIALSVEAIVFKNQRRSYRKSDKKK